jgi:hypothetical protein
MDLLTVADVARALGLTGEGVRARANRGQLPVACRVGPRRARLFDRAAVEQQRLEEAAAQLSKGADLVAPPVAHSGKR